MINMSNSGTAIATASTAQAAKAIGVSRGTLDRLAKDGGGPPFIQIGTTRKYDLAKVAAWYRDQERGGGAPIERIAALAQHWIDTYGDLSGPPAAVRADCGREILDLIGAQR
jgi:hypothetical protein